MKEEYDILEIKVYDLIRIRHTFFLYIYLNKVSGIFFY